MNLKIHCLLVPVILFLANGAGAQGTMNGSVGVLEDTTLSGSYSGTSLTLDASNFTEIGSASGTFASTVPDGTEVTAYSLEIDGLSSAPMTESIDDYLLIGGPGPAEFGSQGTTPVDRFDFDLQSLEESSPGDFIGTGTLSDQADDYSPTAVEMLLSFSNPNTYSFTLMAVPEPTTLALVLAGLGVIPFFRRKK